LTFELKVDNLSTEQTCAGSKFQVDGAETENAREVKLLVIPEGLARRFVLEERKALWLWTDGNAALMRN